jgi:predicted N-acetyltransferase YhbS
MADAGLAYTISPLGDVHDRKSFRSGVEPLDRYLSNQATQDIRRRVSTCFVAAVGDSNEIAGYYTIAMSSIALSEIDSAVGKRLPRYPLVAAARVGRLAVALSHRGKGLGSALIVDSIERALRAEIAAFAVVVDAKDDAAASFYRRHGFAPFASAPMSLYLPLAQAVKALGLQDR